MASWGALTGLISSWASQVTYGNMSLRLSSLGLGGFTFSSSSKGGPRNRGQDYSISEWESLAPYYAWHFHCLFRLSVDLADHTVMSFPKCEQFRCYRSRHLHLWIKFGGSRWASGVWLQSQQWSTWQPTCLWLLLHSLHQALHPMGRLPYDRDTRH